ncbi:MAG: hypothetical protein AB1441_10320 [Bacillota bacterium]
MGRRYAVPGFLVLLAILTGAGFWVWGGTVDGADPEPVVGEYTAFRHEIVYACGDRETGDQGFAPVEIHGLDAAGIRLHFPDADGWSVVANLPEELVVVRQSVRFCQKHAAYRHLGVFEGYVAVYEGPLGGGGEVCQVTDIPVESLPGFYRDKLNQAMAFNQQPEEVQAGLRSEMEFPDEATLHAVMENLDELRQD